MSFVNSRSAEICRGPKPGDWSDEKWEWVTEALKELDAYEWNVQFLNDDKNGWMFSHLEQIEGVSTQQLISVIEDWVDLRRFAIGSHCTYLDECEPVQELVGPDSDLLQSLAGEEYVHVLRELLIVTVIEARKSTRITSAELPDSGLETEAQDAHPRSCEPAQQSTPATVPPHLG